MGARISSDATIYLHRVSENSLRLDLTVDGHYSQGSGHQYQIRSIQLQGYSRIYRELSTWVPPPNTYHSSPRCEGLAGNLRTRSRVVTVAMEIQCRMRVVGNHSVGAKLLC